MMKKRKLGIIGGSGLYKMEGFEKNKWKKLLHRGENHQMMF
jgi:purine nucleoside phosphorylase